MNQVNLQQNSPLSKKLLKSKSAVNNFQSTPKSKWRVNNCVKKVYPKMLSIKWSRRDQAKTTWCPKEWTSSHCITELISKQSMSILMISMTSKELKDLQQLTTRFNTVWNLLMNQKIKIFKLRNKILQNKFRNRILRNKLKSKFLQNKLRINVL